MDALDKCRIFGPYEGISNCYGRSTFKVRNVAHTLIGVFHGQNQANTITNLLQGVGVTMETCNCSSKVVCAFPNPT
jgi:hypothetical protein